MILLGRYLQGVPRNKRIIREPSVFLHNRFLYHEHGHLGLAYASSLTEQCFHSLNQLNEMFRIFRENLGDVFGLFDLLWIGLAVFTAWRIPGEPPPTAGSPPPAG